MKPRPSTSAGDLKGKERKKYALDRRIAGARYSEIGAELGVSRQRAHAMVEAELKEAAAKRHESAEKVRRMELRRLDAMFEALAVKIASGDTQAIDTALRIAARRAKLEGLDQQGDVSDLTFDLAELVTKARQKADRSSDDGSSKP